MAIAYKSAGAGASTESSGTTLNVPWPATVDANDIGVLHAYYEGVVTTPATPAGFALLGGPFGVTTVGRHYVYGKLAVGNEDGTNASLGSAAVTTMRSGRLYTLSGYESGSLAELIRVVEATTHATDPQMPTVETRIAGALAAALVVQNDNNALGSATGESGGDWTEAVAEYVAALNPGLVLQLQTCTPTANPGTVSGGAVAATDDPSGVIGLEIRPKPTTDLVFPTNTTILDNFNRANGALGANWDKWGALPVASIESERLKGEGAGNGGGSFVKEKFGPDAEVFITLNTEVGVGNFFGIAIRQSTPTTSFDGYYVECSEAAGTTEIKEGSGESVTNLGPVISTPWKAGDKLGVSVIGSTIRAYRYPSGGSAWELIGTRSDATFAASGYFAVWRSGGTARLDDFGGGTVIVATSAKPSMIL